MRRRLLSHVAAAVIFSVVTCAPGRGWAQDNSQEEARTHVARGYELFDEGDFRLALVEFERAYAIAPSYKILFNLGQVHLELGQYARAHAALTRYLAEGGAEIAPDRRASVEKDLASLQKRIATLSVQSEPPGAQVTIDDRPLGNAPIVRAVVDAGELRVRVASAGFASETRIVKLAGGDDVTASFALQPEQPLVVTAPAPAPIEPAREGLPTPAVVGFVATGVLTVGAIGAGIAALSASARFDEMKRTPIDGSPEQAAADLRRQGNRTDALAITTDVLVVSALVAGGVSLWFALRPRSSASPIGPAAHAAARPAIRPLSFSF